MYHTYNEVAREIEAGGRSGRIGNRGKIVKVRIIGTEKIGVVAVQRLGKEEKIYPARTAHHLRSFIQAKFNTQA